MKHQCEHGDDNYPAAKPGQRTQETGKERAQRHQSGEFKSVHVRCIVLGIMETAEGRLGIVHLRRMKTDQSPPGFAVSIFLRSLELDDAEAS